MKKKRLHLTTLLCLIAAWMLFTTGCKNIGEELVYYTVTFDSDGGSDVPAQTVESGKTAVEPRSPTKQGHNFVAWYNGNTEFNFKTPVTSDLTLKAKWTPTDSPDDGEGRGDNDSDTGEGSEQDDTTGSGNTTNPDNKDEGDGEGGGDNGSDTGEGSGQDDTTGSGNTTNPDNKDEGDIDDIPAACEVSASQLGTLTSADLAKDEFGDTYTIRLVGAWIEEEVRLLGLKLKDIPDSKHITLDMTHTTGITKLYDAATPEEGTFYECVALTAVLFPNTLKTISDYTFAYCTSLVNVVIPNSVESIGAGAFGICSSLTNITIPDSVTAIGVSAFASCNSLTNITIPDSVTTIGDSAFDNCRLTSIIIPASVTHIGQNPFKNNSPQSITVASGNSNYYSFGNCLINRETKTLISGFANSTIPETVTVIGERAFAACELLTNIEIPKTVTAIGEFAFYGTSLVSIVIPDGVETICNYTFFGCTSLTSVEIPDSVTAIKSYAFCSCPSLEKIKFTGTKEKWRKISKVVGWNRDTPATKVTCIDGEVDL